MWYLAFEIWPYLVGTLAIGLATGWFAGCAPRRQKPLPESGKGAS